MARTSVADVERRLTVATQGLTTDAIRVRLARFAREKLAEAISTGAGHANYERYVNGRAGATEESVQPPGPIVYRFGYVDRAAEWALDWLRKNSAVQSGRFQNSFFVLTPDLKRAMLKDLRAAREVLVVNDQPYSRRLEVGKNERGGPFVVQIKPRLFRRCKNALKGQFGPTVEVYETFVELPDGYVLKGRSKRRFRSRGGVAAGARMKYPALRIRVPE